MDNALYEECESEIGMVSLAFERGTPLFHKAALIISYKLVNAHLLDEAKKFIKTYVPRDYIESSQFVEHMEQDDLYARLAVKVAEAFRAGSMVEPPTFQFDSKRLFVQKQAKA